MGLILSIIIVSTMITRNNWNNFRNTIIRFTFLV
jgi:hypothetical protein